MAKATNARGALHAITDNADDEVVPTTATANPTHTESDTGRELKGDSNISSVSNNYGENETVKDQKHRDDHEETKCYSDKVNSRSTRNSMSRSDDRSSTRSNGSSKKTQDSAEALENALEQLGHFGLYQRYALFLLCVPNLFSAMYSLNYVFVADQVPFRCVIDECVGHGSWFDNATIQEMFPEDRCRRYVPVSPDRLSCVREDYQNTTVACESFVYENMDTIYAEFGLACNEWQRTLVGTVRNAALPLALILTGYISDSWGRRTAFCIFSAFAGILGIAKSFAPHYRVYLAMEFFEAALGYGFNSAAYVMMVELARPSLRAAFACATGVGYGLGGVLYALIANRIRYWRYLLRAIHAPALLLPIYWLLLDESVRWLHATQRRERAVAAIRRVAQWNTITLDEGVLSAVGDKNEVDERKCEGNPWLSLVKSRVLMLRFAACSWCWVAASFVYYGLTINSVSLSGNKYTNFALNMAMEIVASLLIMMALERFGRKRSILVAFLICGVACVTPYFVSNVRTGLGMFFVGKLAITFAFNSLYVYTTELFPTRARSSALAAVSLVGRLGSVLAPQTPLLSVPVQAVLYGACSVSAALAVLSAPETRRAPLPQHVRGAETLHAPDPALDTALATRL